MTERQEASQNTYQIEQAKINGLDIKLYASLRQATADIINNYLNKASSAVAINPEKIILS